MTDTTTKRHLVVKQEWRSSWRSQDLVKRCVDAGKCGSTAANRHDADIYRVAAQLLLTHYPVEAARLKQAAEPYFAASGQLPRSFSQFIDDGLMYNLARLRNLMENALAGVRSW